MRAKNKRSLCSTLRKVSIFLLLAIGASMWGISQPEAIAQLTEAECVIICPATLEFEANILSNFHTVTEGITSTVVTTEAIDANYAAAEDPPFSGYKNTKLRGRRQVTNYDHDLAKKIVAYLRDTVAHPNLAYVALLGDAALVPPSYYYSEGGNKYGDWVPSDLFYSSPDYDLFPDLEVGRLPVSDSLEAAALVNKIINWYASADWNWFHKAYIAAGRRDNLDTRYNGELVVTETINQGFLSGMDLTKCLHTDGTFDTAHIEPALTNADVGILFHVGHGDGNVFKWDGDDLYVSDVMAYPPNVEVPVIISPSCYNAAFDLDLVERPKTPMGSPYDTSIGEAMLKSQAGGIAYIGNPREDYGDTRSTIVQGNLIVTKMPRIDGMLHYILKSYHEGADTLGDLYSDSIHTYIFNNDMGEPDNIAAVFKIALLGDPALKIPVQQPAAVEYQKATVTAVAPAYYSQDDMPVYGLYDATITATTDSPSVKTKLINTDTDTTIDLGTIDYPPFEYISTQQEPGIYLIRTATEAGVASTGYAKENWMYFEKKDGIGPSDTEPPTVPTNLMATAVSSFQIDLTWDPSTDNVGVTGYNIYRDGVPIDTSENTTYSDSGLSPSTTYTYEVNAFDAAGNTSDKSLPDSATTFEGLSIHVYSIDMSTSTQNKGKNEFRKALATVTIVDASDNPVEGAAVSGYWSGATTDSNAGITDSEGKVTLESDGVKNPPSGTTYTFTVDDVVLDGWTYDPGANVETSVSINTPLAPALSAIAGLGNAYPNPGNPEIWIPFTLSGTEHVTIRIYSATGRLVRTLDLGQKPSGAYISKDKAAYWDGRNEAGEQVSSDIYFCAMQAGEYTILRKIVMAR